MSGSTWTIVVDGLSRCLNIGSAWGNECSNSKRPCFEDEGRTLQHTCGLLPFGPCRFCTELLFHRVRWSSLELCTDCTSQYPTPKVQTRKPGNLVRSVQLTNQGPEFYVPRDTRNRHQSQSRSRKGRWRWGEFRSNGRFPKKFLASK